MTKGEHLRFIQGHNMRTTQLPPTEEEVEAARRKKLGNPRDIPDGEGSFPEYMKKNECPRWPDKHPAWLGDVPCPVCRPVEKTERVHFEYEEADWSRPFTEAGLVIRREYEEAMS